MGLTIAEKNFLADQETARCGFASLHSGDPGTTGANELVAAPYTREAVAWAGAASGEAASSADIVFDVAAATVVKFVGLWSAVAAGTFRAGFPTGSGQSLPFTADTADVVTSPGHAFVNGDEVVVIDTGGASLPTGLAEGTVYFVRDVAGATFKLAATVGGAAIDLTAAGAGFVVSQTTETFGGVGTYKIPSGGLVFDLLAVT